MSTQIPRGSDLTEADLNVIADDACEVTLWCMRNRIKRAEWSKQIARAIEARLGRRPLVLAEASAA